MPVLVWIFSLVYFFLRNDGSHCVMISSLSRCLSLDSGYVRMQPVAVEEYCGKYLSTLSEMIPGFFKILEEEPFENIVGNQHFLIFIRPSKTGRIMVSPVAGGSVGGVPHSLSGAYLQDYASYGYETSWVYRSHQGGVQCTGTITLACFFLSYCPLFIFILEFCPVHIFKTILAMVMKFCWWIDLINRDCSAQEP